LTCAPKAAAVLRCDAQDFEDRVRHAWTRGGPEAIASVLADYKIAKGNPCGTARPGYSFREIAEKARAAGGPKGKWLAGRDKPGMRRLDWIIDRLGDYDIDDITLAVISEKVIEDLEKRPTRRGNPQRPRRHQSVPSGSQRRAHVRAEAGSDHAQAGSAVQ
jgi:hypothetical protein